jgi:hypothetical protein
MKVSIEDLKKGDVVITNVGATVAEVKLLRQPQLAKIGSKVTWTGKPRWTSIPCAYRVESETYTTKWNHTYTKTMAVIADGKEYNKETRIDFSEKVCWLIKREAK